MFDLLCPWPPGPTFDLFLTSFNCSGVSGPLARPQFHNSKRLGHPQNPCKLTKRHSWGIAFVIFLSGGTIRTSWITLHHFIFQESLSVIATPPITPNRFWGFNKRNSQEKSHHPVLSLSGKLHNLLRRNTLRELVQSRKCAINNFSTKNPRGLLGWGSRGSCQIIYVRIFPSLWSVFGTTRRPNINNFRDRRPA